MPRSHQRFMHINYNLYLNIVSTELSIWNDDEEFSVFFSVLFHGKWRKSITERRTNREWKNHNNKVGKYLIFTWLITWQRFIRRDREVTRLCLFKILFISTTTTNELNEKRSVSGGDESIICVCLFSAFLSHSHRHISTPTRRMYMQIYFSLYCWMLDHQIYFISLNRRTWITRNE